MWYGIFCCMNLYILVPAITNIQYMIELFKDPFQTISSSGNLSGTAFYFASGFMIFIRINAFYDAKGRITVFNYFSMLWYVYWKLIPLMAMTFFFGWYVLPFLGRGPQWHKIETFFFQCEGVWWKNMLFINNLFWS
jgi:hypothetical protein